MYRPLRVALDSPPDTGRDAVRDATDLLAPMGRPVAGPGRRADLAPGPQSVAGHHRQPVVSHPRDRRRRPDPAFCYGRDRVAVHRPGPDPVRDLIHRAGCAAVRDGSPRRRDGRRRTAPDRDASGGIPGAEPPGAQRPHAVAAHRQPGTASGPVVVRPRAAGPPRSSWRSRICASPIRVRLSPGSATTTSRPA